MAEFTLRPDPALWHEVPVGGDSSVFVDERTAGLTGDALDRAQAVAEVALDVSAGLGDLVLMLQEPRTQLCAIATFALFDDGQPPATASEAVELVTGGEAGPWEPTVVDVGLGDVSGYRVSEVFRPPGDPDPETALHALTSTQTTYVVSVAGRLGMASLTPAPLPAAGAVLALVEPVIATWSVEQ